MASKYYVMTNSSFYNVDLRREGAGWRRNQVLSFSVCNAGMTIVIVIVSFRWAQYFFAHTCRLLARRRCPRLCTSHLHLASALRHGTSSIFSSSTSSPCIRQQRLTFSSVLAIAHAAQLHWRRISKDTQQARRRIQTSKFNSRVQVCPFICNLVLTSSQQTSHRSSIHPREGLPTTMCSISLEKYAQIVQKWFTQLCTKCCSDTHDHQIQINTTCQVSRMIALEAAKRNVKAYVRLQLPFYECSSKGSHDEKENAKPSGTIGIWWHETLRMLAAIDECVFTLWLFHT